MRLPHFDKYPRAVAIDLDGTLLNSQSELSERNRKALLQCLDQGLPVIIATSRPFRTTRRLVGADIIDRCSLVLMNGAYARGRPPLSGEFSETLDPAGAGRCPPCAGNGTHSPGHDRA